MVFPSEAVSLDPDAYDELIRNQGVTMLHYRSMRCPVGMSDPDDLRRPHEHHADCSNGFLYTLSGAVTVAFLGNSKEERFADVGRLDSAGAEILIPRFYDDKDATPVELAQFDRIYLADESVTVVNWQTFATHASGIDRLQFPAVRVQDLVDSRGTRYAPGLDFEIRGGQIHWLGQSQPGIDPDTGKGVVCSARYTYRPFWYVARMPHEIRLAQVEDDTGRHVVRMPQQAAIQREMWFEKEQRDAEAPHPDSPRQKPGPADGGFGPR